METKVSIIVPVYNSENYIEETIESILNQSLKEIELILINDGSTDKSINILRKYEKDYKNIKTIDIENGGPGRARNIGIRTARGKYIGFVDSDDTIDKNMFKVMYDLSKNESQQMIMCAYNEISSEGSVFEVHHYLEEGVTHNEEYIKKHIISTFSEGKNLGMFSLCNKLYLREWIMGLGFLIDEERYHGEDWWFNIKAFLNLKSYICTDKALYNYRKVNSKSLMAEYRVEQIDLCLDGREKLLNILPKEFINYKEFNKNFSYEYYSYLVRTVKEVKNKKLSNELIRKVVREKEVIECAKNSFELPFSLKFINLLIKSNMELLLIAFIRIRSLV